MTTTILVASDFSSSADRALGEAIFLAGQLHANVEIVHVHSIRMVPIPPVLDALSVAPSPDELAQTEVSLSTRVSRLREVGITAIGFSCFGVPAIEVVRRAADIGARYILVGRHGHRALTEILVGSVAADILRNAPCAVLVIPAVAHGKTA